VASTLLVSTQAATYCVGCVDSISSGHSVHVVPDVATRTECCCPVSGSHVYVSSSGKCWSSHAVSTHSRHSTGAAAVSAYDYRAHPVALARSQQAIEQRCNFTGKAHGLTTHPDVANHCGQLVASRSGHICSVEGIPTTIDATVADRTNVARLGYNVCHVVFACPGFLRVGNCRVAEPGVERILPM
jgi:hypothetical protein